VLGREVHARVYASDVPAVFRLALESERDRARMIVALIVIAVIVGAIS
jgi:hypothetical protein